MTQVFPVLPHPSFPPHSSLPIRWMSPEVLPLDPPGPRLVPRGPLEGEVWVGLGSHLFPHSVPLFCLQGSGHLAFALTSATDQKQEAYSGTPEVKVPRAGVGGVLCSGLDWRRDSRKRAHPDWHTVLSAPQGGEQASPRSPFLPESQAIPGPRPPEPRGWGGPSGGAQSPREPSTPATQNPVPSWPGQVAHQNGKCLEGLGAGLGAALGETSVFLCPSCCLELPSTLSALCAFALTVPFAQIFSSLCPLYLAKWKWSRSVVSDSLRPVDCSPPSSSVHGILQARILEWVAISFSKEKENFAYLANFPRILQGSTKTS